MLSGSLPATSPVHPHEGFRTPDEDATPYGITGLIDLAPVGLLVAASWDRCVPCQDTALDQLATAPASAARLVEMLGVITSDAFGGIPPAMYDDADLRAGSHHPALRAALRAAMRPHGEGEIDRRALYDVVAALSPSDRREMCDNATDTLIGALAMTEQPPARRDDDGPIDDEYRYE